MTSLATLAHAAPAAPAFNANFYIVTATIIPVIFLAIAVQDCAYCCLQPAATKRPLSLE